MTTATDKFRLLHTMLRVKDLDAALDFYTEWKSIYVDFSGRLQKAQIDTHGE